MVDARGIIGWAPASFLVPISENDIQEEEEENQQLIEQERGKKLLLRPTVCCCICWESLLTV